MGIWHFVLCLRHGSVITFFNVPTQTVNGAANPRMSAVQSHKNKRSVILTFNLILPINHTVQNKGMHAAVHFKISTVCAHE